MERAYPLQWPAGRARTPAHKRDWSRFDVTLGRAQKHMHEEIERMNGKNIVISTAQRVRRDGLIYAKDADRTPDDPGVAVYFLRKGQRVCFACDQYYQIWENMRAIGKTIEAMRGIERWGSSEMLDRAFTGFAALPPPDAPIEMSGPGEISKPWHQILAVDPSAPWNAIRAAYRDKMREADDTAKYSINAAYEQAKTNFAE